MLTSFGAHGPWGGEHRTLHHCWRRPGLSENGRLGEGLDCADEGAAYPTGQPGLGHLTARADSFLWTASFLWAADVGGQGRTLLESRGRVLLSWKPGALWAGGWGWPCNKGQVGPQQAEYQPPCAGPGLPCPPVGAAGPPVWGLPVQSQAADEAAVNRTGRAPQSCLGTKVCPSRAAACGSEGVSMTLAERQTTRGGTLGLERPPSSPRHQRREGQRAGLSA